VSSDRAAEPLEAGDIYFLYRPRVGDDQVQSLDDVQRLLIVLRPWTRAVLRLLVVGRKRLPEISAHERTWCFVDRVADRPEELREAVDRRTYRTKTRGERVQPPARPAGEGAYVIARHDDHTHLAYELELPRRIGEVQRDLNIEAQASHIVAVRNPYVPPPPDVGRPRPGPSELPSQLRDHFRGRRFAPLDPPDFLDHPGVEIVLIGAAPHAAQELDLDLTPEAEAAARDSLFDDLHIGRRHRLLEPLFTGVWG
jgi:hypothetical protein